MQRDVVGAWRRGRWVKLRKGTPTPRPEPSTAPLVQEGSLQTVMLGSPKTELCDEIADLMADGQGYTVGYLSRKTGAATSTVNNILNDNPDVFYRHGRIRKSGRPWIWRIIARERKVNE